MTVGGLIPVAATAAGIAGALLLARARPAGLVWLAVSVGLLRWPQSIWTTPVPVEMSPAKRRGLLLAVMALAVAFRCYRIDPPGLWGDDAVNGLLAFDILDGKVRSPFEIVVHSHSHFHALTNYPIAAAFWLFGADPSTLRLPGALMGAAGAPLLYGIAAPLFGARVALLAALFYACSPPQIGHAKHLAQVMTGQFVLLAGLCLLVRGMAGGLRAMVAAAGLPLALSVYTYHSARIAPLIPAVYIIATLWAQRRAAGLAATGHLRHRGAGAPVEGKTIMATGAIFALALIPAIVGYAKSPHALVARVSGTSIWAVVRQEDSWLPLWDSVWRTAAIFHYQQGPRAFWVGIGDDPAFNAIVAFLLVHGMLVSMAGWRQPRHALLLVWVAVGLLPGLLSEGAPRIYRAVYATPPLYVWAALPLVQLLAFAGQPRARRWILHPLVAALTAAVPVVDAQYYFCRVYSHPVFHWYQAEGMVDMARALRRRGPGWTGYVLADSFTAEHETLRFLRRAWDLDVRGVASLSAVLPLNPVPERGALFAASGAALPVAAAIRDYYPGSEGWLHHEPAPRSWAFPSRAASRPPAVVTSFVGVPRAVAERPRQAPAVGLVADLVSEHHQLRRMEPYPFYAFRPETLAEPFRTVLRGRLVVPEPGGYGLDIASNGPWMLWIDGRPTRITDALPAGDHDVRVEIGEVPGRLELAISWRREGGDLHLVPLDAWRPLKATADRGGESSRHRR